MLVPRQKRKKKERKRRRPSYRTLSRRRPSADRHGFHQQYEICFVKKYSLYTVVMLKLFLLFALVCRIPEILHFLLPPPIEGEEGSASAVLAFPPTTSKSSPPPPPLFFSTKVNFPDTQQHCLSSLLLHS